MAGMWQKPRVGVILRSDQGSQYASKVFRARLTELKMLQSMSRRGNCRDNAVADAHKLAAWNERRLLRDLYDCYYWYVNVKVMPNMEVLSKCLQKVNSRLPSLRKIKKLSIAEFADHLLNAVNNLTEKQFVEQLRPLIPMEQLEGLLPIFQVKLREFAYKLEKFGSTYE